jgi:predicted dinucleotide-binding enzyme
VTTAIIGTGGIGSVIARQLASGGETLRLSSAGPGITIKMKDAAANAASWPAATMTQVRQFRCPDSC